MYGSSATSQIIPISGHEFLISLIALQITLFLFKLSVPFLSFKLFGIKGKIAIAGIPNL